MKGRNNAAMGIRKCVHCGNIGHEPEVIARYVSRGDALSRRSRGYACYSPWDCKERRDRREALR